jgi:hypothetical protein
MFKPNMTPTHDHAMTGIRKTTQKSGSFTLGRAIWFFLSWTFSSVDASSNCETPIEGYNHYLALKVTNDYKKNNDRTCVSCTILYEIKYYFFTLKPTIKNATTSSY